MIERDISRQVLANARWFPVVSVTGPRQSGKSTLVKHLFADYEYINLEDDRFYNLAMESPADFIRERPGRLVIDEAQRIPEIFNAIQVASDERGETGQYVLSGSQNFLLSRRITQSLAGRVGVVKLLPLSFRELASSPYDAAVDDFMVTGGYPRIYDVGIPANVFYRNYVSTYVERDASEHIGPQNLMQFRVFLGLCAQAAGNLVNVSRFAADLGVARATVSSWLSILESSYIVFRLAPYHANTRKRLTKTPKLYFYDTGLLCHLLGIKTPEELRDSGLRGAVFENLVIAETLKRHLNGGYEPEMFFYRDDSKVEVDLVDLTNRSDQELVEIKSSQTYQKRFERNLSTVGDMLGFPTEGRSLVMRGDASAQLPNCKLWSAYDWLLRSCKGDWISF